MNSFEGDSMQENNEIKALKNEVQELRSTIMNLKKKVTELSIKLEEPIKQKPSNVENQGYQIFSKDGLMDYDLSWERLVRLLQNCDYGLTTEELAERWGKSRSRTSEVLNKLVDEGVLVKYRDGRNVIFRTVEED
jgi:DNA-binding transcriptional ArsR family regulator